MPDPIVIEHVTPSGGNVFADLGFPPAEAKALKAEAHRRITEIPGAREGARD
ncbi:hypothetical protein [Salipiger sp. PrR003]|uniref:hypothetical protein n=1 Tax=Salipiger sp. PrR003 TaxID=2706776 RepID=UPI0013D94FAF|nr:hypothetical protein [Salipiger sp. PrR003]NDV52262.1 hypothetical protein [Salipiger sp. PrR003]